MFHSQNWSFHFGLAYWSMLSAYTRIFFLPWLSVPNDLDGASSFLSRCLNRNSMRLQSRFHFKLFRILLIYSVDVSLSIPLHCFVFSFRIRRNQFDYLCIHCKSIKPNETKCVSKYLCDMPILAIHSCFSVSRAPFSISFILLNHYWNLISCLFQMLISLPLFHIMGPSFTFDFFLCVCVCVCCCFVFFLSTSDQTKNLTNTTLFPMK